MKSKILILVTAFLVLGVSLLATRVNATGNSHHRAFTEWKYGEVSQCEAVNDCGSEGQTSQTRTRYCENVGGYGDNECQIFETCPEGYSAITNELEKFFHPGKCAKGSLLHRQYANIIYTPETEEEVVHEACTLEEYNSCRVYCEDETALNYKEEGQCEYETPQTYCIDGKNVEYLPSEAPKDVAVGGCFIVTPDPRGEEKPSAPVCTTLETLVLPANFFVERNGGSATLRWWPTAGSEVNIYVLDADTNVRVGSKPDQPNNGVSVVELLDPNKGYTFELEQKNGCSSGQLVRVGVIDGPSSRIFVSSYWTW